MNNKFGKFFFVFSIFLILFSCGTKKDGQTYQIGIDATWYPLELSGREKNVLAFSIELLQEIAKKENIQFSITPMNWNNLLWGLTEKKYDAILTSLYPYIFYQKRFHFSEVYLQTGPVLVAAKNSKIKTLNDLKDKRVGIIQGSPNAQLVEKYPGLLLQTFESIPATLNAIENDQIDAAVLQVLPAQSYVRDLYADKLKITTLPLNDQGLRLIMLDSQEPKLIRKFNAGLKDLQKSGRYEEILKKWGLSETHPTANLDQEIELFLKNFAA